MATIQIETRMRAPIEVCFDLARDVDAHAESAAFTAERIVPPGKTTGLLDLGDLVAFEGRHFGIVQRFVARITEIQRPDRFIDEMVEGAFKRLRHVHEFEQVGEETIMRDTLEWEAPFGLLGKLVDRLFLCRHMRWFVETKQRVLKQMAENRAGLRAK